jgi:hypothetical protein
MAWLGGWLKRIKLTIDKDQIDGDLENFPVPIYLSASSGQSNDDVSAIFDELSTVSGTKKIAITTDDEETQCYVEIERWDWSNEKAWLHVNVPTIISGTDTELYIYYDSIQDDNDTYVGDVSSTPGRTVWDSNFKAVYHLGEDPTGGTGCIKDSTDNVNDGTPGGTMLIGDLVDGKFGKALNFDGTDDYINCGSGTSLDDITSKTIEAVVYLTTFGEALAGRIAQKASVNVDGWNLSVQGSPYNRLYFGQDWNGGTFANWRTNLDTILISTWYGFVITYDNSSTANEPLMYIDGVSQTVNVGVSPVGSCDSDAANSMWIAARNNSGPDREFDGKVDELRISDVIRTSAWIKATYEGLWDNLLTFGVEESPVFYYEGYVTVESAPSVRIINLYKRDTGELIDSTTSSGVGGYFKVSSVHDDYHFIVVLPDLSDNYAILTDDKIHPTGGN